MGLKDKLLQDLKEALKSRNSLKVDTLRLVSSEIKNKEIDLHKELGDDEIIALLSTQIKKRKEAAALYEQGGRTDLKEKEEKEMAVLESYLPEQVDEEALRRRIREVIAETGAQSPKDMGKVMKVVAPEFRGRADGNQIKTLVTEMLAG